MKDFTGALVTVKDTKGKLWSAPKGVEARFEKHRCVSNLTKDLRRSWTPAAHRHR